MNLRIYSGTGVILIAMGFLQADPASVPDWWSDGTVGIYSMASEQNEAVANLGQAKHVAMQFAAELDQAIPGGAGFNLYEVFPEPPALGSRDSSWYKAQIKALNIGQLKALAMPFYDRLHDLAPVWLASELSTNGTDEAGTYFPWSWTTADDKNLAMATVGQLKALFCLRTRDDDGDNVADLLEHVFYGSAGGNGAVTDYDGDGLSDATELTSTPATSPWETDTDGDGISDYDDAYPTTPDDSGGSSPSGIIVWCPRS